MAKVRELGPKDARSRSINMTVVERARKGRKPLTEAEREPAARFKRVAGIRVAKILKLCKGLRNCANPTVYKYSPEQVKEMLTALDKAIQRVHSAYRNPVGNGNVPKPANKVESFFS